MFGARDMTDHVARHGEADLQATQASLDDRVKARGTLFEPARTASAPLQARPLGVCVTCQEMSEQLQALQQGKEEAEAREVERIRAGTMARLLAARRGLRARQLRLPTWSSSCGSPRKSAWPPRLGSRQVCRQVICIHCTGASKTASVFC